MNVHARIQPATAGIDQLKPGHDFPGANLNSRTAGRQQDVEQLAASIKQEGLLMPLIVVPDPKDVRGYYVVDGNRRFAALQMLVKQKHFDKEAAVDIRVESNLDAATALRKSLAANMHIPLHPVDQFEAFAACMEKGDTPAVIAERYALTEKVVKQRLALGQMSPAVRDAWRKGKIRREAAEAYAASSNHQVQEKHLKQGGYRATQEYEIRKAMVGDASEIQKLLKFVGEDAYKAAGGKLVEDLFGDKEGRKFADLGILHKLSQAKLKKLSEEYIAKGYGWTQFNDDHYSHHSMQRKEKPTNAEKAKLGVVFYFDYNDTFHAETGYIKPGTKGVSAGATNKDGGKAKIKPKKPSNTLSNSLKFDLDKMAAKATKLALANEKHPTPLVTVLAGVVASQITPDRFNYMPSELKTKLAAIRDGISAKVMAEAMQKAFDSKRYFMGAPKGHVVKAISDAIGDAEAKKAAAGTKSGAWKYALSHVVKTGWLPAELRTATYSGPGASKKKGK